MKSTSDEGLFVYFSIRCTYHSSTFKKEDYNMLKEYDFSKAKRGPIVPPQPNKARITIRLDMDILDWFREQVNVNGGGSYQSMINSVLRDHKSKICAKPPVGKI